MGSHLIITAVRLESNFYSFEPPKNVQLLFLLKHSDGPQDKGTVQPLQSTDETEAAGRDVTGSRSQS